MVDDGLEVTDEVGDFDTKGNVDGYPDCFLDDASGEGVCNGNALATKKVREERWASRVLRVRVWRSTRPVCVWILNKFSSDRSPSR